MKAEYIPLVMNTGLFLYRLLSPLWGAPWQPGLVLYWLGATILTFGLTLMKG